MRNDEYTVLPQWKVGKYRIDLVVEGNGKQLAIECDGDRYHTLENLPEDMARQAILERIGWQFVRIRGSLFFRDPDKAMESVYKRLHELDITPQITVPECANDINERSELVERVIRRAEEIRREWDTEDDDSISQVRSKGENKQYHQYSARTTARDKNHDQMEDILMQQTLFEDVSEQPKQPPHGRETNNNLSSSNSMVNDRRSPKTVVRQVGNIPEDKIITVLYHYLSKAPIERERLLVQAARDLGYASLTKEIRHHINKVISSEIQKKHVIADDGWKKVWIK